MKPLIILLFVIGFGIWMIATGSADIFLTTTDSSAEVVSEDSSKESSITDNAEPIQEIESSTLEEISAETLLVAENDVIENDSESINEAQYSEKDTYNTKNTLAEDDLDSLGSDTSEVTDEPTIVAEANTAAETTTTESNQESSDSTPSTTIPPTNPHLGSMWMSPMQNPMNNFWMNPMFNMMMQMMGPMMNPAMYMNPMSIMNHPINAMTQAQSMDYMMRSMDPHLLFGMFGQTSEGYKNGEVPDQLPVVTIPGFPTQTYQNWPRNKVSPGVSREAKKNAFQTMMGISPLSMRDMLGIITDKVPVAEDVTWDDAVEAMKLRANEVNFKFVGSSPLWKEIEAVTGEPSARVEMFRFCDAAVARKILDEIPEFIVFLPCKIALIEDGDGKLWVMTLDWDVSWLDFAQNPNNHLAKDLREDATRIRENMRYIMEGAATGDF